MTDTDVSAPLESGDMYSTAFQFYSHISAKVDPRTGTYGASVDLSSGEGNHLRGPNLPFRLSYSALGVGHNEGFGEGWRLALTEVDLTTRIVTLSSGDSHRYEGLFPESSATFPDRKLDSFSLVRPGPANDAIVEHITGVIEHLGMLPGSTRYLRPVRIVNPSGDSIHLHWGFAAGRSVLLRVSDDEGETLLSLDYTLTSVVLTLHLGHGDMTMHFTLRGVELHRITVPLINQLNARPTSRQDEAAWQFDYYPLANGMRLLAAVVSPDGIREEALYDASALRLPAGAPMTSMPAVSTHTRRRVSDLTVIQKTDYSYDTFNLNNFYGFPVVASWQNRNDQLLHLIGQDAFRYGSKETQYDGADVATTVERDYNQFHLIVRERTTRGSVVQDVVTEYGQVPNEPFERQPKAFQLPKTIRTTTRHAASPQTQQVTYVDTEYDSHGNIERRYDSATDTTEISSYYPPEGEVDGGVEVCPPDPIGLVRRLKSRRVEPGARGGPVRETRYRYTRVPVRQTALAWTRNRTYYVQASEETSFSVEDGTARELAHNVQHFIDDQGPQHGSLRSETHEQDGLEETRDFTYEIDDAGKTLTKHTRESTHDGIETHTSETLYQLSGLVRAVQDAQGNVTQYEYDGMSRRTAEVVAPDDEAYRTETRWNYQLSMAERWVERIGITGLPHRVWMDEQRRVIRREEPLEDGSLFVVDELEHDVFGQLIREVETDRLRERLLQRESTFQYDDWGQRKLETAPDGSETLSQTSLVVDPGDGRVLTQTVQWQVDRTGERTGWRANYTDAAGQQVRTQNGLWSGDERLAQMTTEWEYDGLGRCVTMTEAFETTDRVNGDTRAVEKVTRQTWDAYDRLATSTLPDGTLVKRTYAPGHDSELLASLAVVPPDDATEVQLGTRTWDGLERMLSEQAGSLVSRHEYIPGQMSPARKTMPDGSVVNMNYDRRLREVLLDSTLTDARTRAQTVVTEAAYHKRVGLPSLITTPNGSMDVTLDYLGRMTQQTIALQGTDPRQCGVAVSPGGLVLEKTGTDGVIRRFEYDDIGRTTSVTDQDVTVELDYGAFSRLERLRTTSSAGRSVTQAFGYDSQGRISTQTWDHIDETSSLTRRLVLTWRPDDKLAGRSWYDGADRLLRDETMDYDDRGRLIDHRIQAEAGEHPQDEMLQPYVRQQFEHDAIDNLRKVTTTRLDGQVNVTDYGYDATDFDRLVSVRNSLAGYPGHGTPLELTYDANGNLTDDGQGHALEWDGMGRLASVTLPDDRTIRYLHGPDSRVCQVVTPERSTYRYREDGTIAFEIDQIEGRRYIRAEGTIVAETRIAATVREVLLLGTDPQGSVVTESGAD
ncbi:RHS repeat domain-containing protein [Luteibacter jiangsuensis]